MRNGIEPQAAALAAVNATDEGLAEIEEALQRMADAERGMDDPLESDIAFHRAVLVAGGNRFFAQMTAFVDTALRVSIRYTNAAKGVAGADVDAHAQVYRAIKNRNPKMARKKVENLLGESMDLIESGPLAKRTG